MATTQPETRKRAVSRFDKKVEARLTKSKFTPQECDVLDLTTTHPTLILEIAKKFNPENTYENTEFLFSAKCLSLGVGHGSAHAPQLAAVVMNHGAARMERPDDDQPWLITETMPSATILSISESSTEISNVFVMEDGDKSSLRDIENHAFLFGSAVDKEKFVYSLVKAVGPQVNVTTTISTLKSIDECSRVHSNMIRKLNLETKLSDVMESTENDHLRLAANADASTIFVDAGDTKVYFSAKVVLVERTGLANNQSRVLALTSSSIFLLKPHHEKNYHRKQQIHYNHIEAMYLDTNGTDVLIKINLAVSEMSSDLLFRLTTNERFHFERYIDSLFFDTVVSQLEVFKEGNIWWRKRGMVERWMHKAIHMIRPQEEQSISAHDEEACKWVLWLITRRTYPLITLLSTVVDNNDVKNVARGLVSICEHSGCVAKLLREAITYELTTTATSSSALFRGENLTCKIISEYVGHSGEDFAVLVLSATMKAFLTFYEASPFSLEIDVNRIMKEDGVDSEVVVRDNASQLQHWVGRFLSELRTSTKHLPHEMKVVIALIYEICNDMGKDPMQFVGGFVMLRYFSPAISMPARFNSGEDAAPAARRNLTLIAKVLQNLANHTTGEREPGMALMVDWAKNHFSVMDSFLKSLLYTNVVMPDNVTSDFPSPRSETEKAGEPWTVTRFARITSDFQSISLQGQKTKLLFELHRLLSPYTEKFVAKLWVDMEFVKLKSSLVTPSRDRALPPGGDKASEGGVVSPPSQMEDEYDPSVAHSPRRRATSPMRSAFPQAMASNNTQSRTPLATVAETSNTDTKLLEDMNASLNREVRSLREQNRLLKEKDTAMQSSIQKVEGQLLRACEQYVQERNKNVVYENVFNKKRVSEVPRSVLGLSMNASMRPQKMRTLADLCSDCGVMDQYEDSHNIPLPLMDRDKVL